jgi:hypothetical protein
MTLISIALLALAGEVEKAKTETRQVLANTMSLWDSNKGRIPKRLLVVFSCQTLLERFAGKPPVGAGGPELLIEPEGRVMIFSQMAIS